MPAKKTDAAARRDRADRVRKRIDDLRAPTPPPEPAVQQPGETDLAYVERRMREIRQLSSVKPQGSRRKRH